MSANADSRLESALDQVRSLSRVEMARQAGAMKLLTQSPLAGSASASWLPCGDGACPALAAARSALLSRSSLKRFERASREGGRLQARAAHFATERLGMLAALSDLLGVPCGPNTALLRYTPLGGPKLALRGEPMLRLKSRGLRQRDLHVSFTHDGQSHFALVAACAGLRGLGADLVHLPRLERRDTVWIRRFARSFMAGEELLVFDAAAAQSPGSIRLYASAHFSLMEAASKALGTGLKMGCGMGGVQSLPKRALSVVAIEPKVRFALGDSAAARCRDLGAGRLEGFWSAGGEFLLSAALLWAGKPDSETGANPRS